MKPRPRTPSLVAVLALAVLDLAGCAAGMPRSYVDGSLDRGARIAIMPLANYTDRQDASDRIVPLLSVELGRQRGLSVIDQGRVEEVISREPWLLMDRLPPDLVDKFGTELHADAILVGSILSFGYRDVETGAVPEISVSLRLLEIPGGKCLWSSSESRAGDDRESVFGLGRVENLERLASGAVKELVGTLPSTTEAPGNRSATQNTEH